MKSLIVYGVLVLAPAAGPLAVADAMRDPTRPPVVAKAHDAAIHEPPPVLSAIMGTPTARIAIFNGQLVRSGSIVGRYAIEAVLEDHVLYRHAGISQELYLPAAAAFKKPSTAPARSPAGAP